MCKVFSYCHRHYKASAVYRTPKVSGGATGTAAVDTRHTNRSNIYVFAALRKRQIEEDIAAATSTDFAPANSTPVADTEGTPVSGHAA